MKKILYFILYVLFLLVPLCECFASDMSSRLKGRILLQVEDNGEAWYVNPDNENRYFLGRPVDAFRIMQELGLGVSNKDFNFFNNIAPKRLSGKILLKVEDSGKAYYVDPNDLTMYFLGRPVDAFKIMQELGLGITNNDLSEIIVFSYCYAVTKVVDGDTIDIDMNGKIERLRLIGIDTPETVDPRKPIECFGIEASNKAKELLRNKKVKLENDITQGERGKYNRLLRYVYLEDGTFFNKFMIESGYAYEYTYTIPYKYQKEFMEAEKYAKENNLGLWNPNACDLENEDESRNESQSNTIGHIFYTSKYYTAKQYYCDTDLEWKGLSEKYLESYNNEIELLKVYPNKKLNKPCS